MQHLPEVISLRTRFQKSFNLYLIRQFSLMFAALAVQHLFQSIIQISF